MNLQSLVYTFNADGSVLVRDGETLVEGREGQPIDWETAPETLDGELSLDDIRNDALGLELTEADTVVMRWAKTLTDREVASITAKAQSLAPGVTIQVVHGTDEVAVERRV